MALTRRKRVVIGYAEEVAPSRPVNFGDYLPQLNVNTGLLDSSILTEYNAPSTQTLVLQDGGTYENLIIYGDLRAPGVHTLDIRLKNCLLMGGPHIPSTNDGVANFQQNRSGTGKVILEDCEISPQLPALNRDCIRGFRFEIYRSYLHDGIDGAGPLADSSGNANVVIAGCIIENLRYGYPDYDNGVSGATEHTDGTHNDCIQFHGGNNAVFRGNLLRGYTYPLPTATQTTENAIRFTEPRAGIGLLVSKAGAAPTGNSTIIVEKNWFDGCAAQFQVHSDTTCQARGNRFYRNSRTGYYIRIEGARLIPGLTNSDGTINNDGNVWADGDKVGQLLTFPTSNGVTQDPELNGVFTP